VDGTSVGAVSSYTFPSVTGNHTIAATFSQTQYTISSSVQSGNGSISPSGSVSVGGGQSQTFTITPASNYNIAGVTVDGTSVGAVSSYTFPSVTGNHTIAATFSQTQYTISSSVQSGNGSISPSGSTNFSAGQSQTYTITPASNYKISQVLVDGASVGAVSSYSFSNISGNHSIAAVFTQSSFTITASMQGEGTIWPNGTVNVKPGNNQSFKITPLPNNKITNVIVDGSSVGAVSSYSFSNVSANHTIAAVCEGTYKISASVKGKGSISPAGNVTVTSGENLTYTITPQSNNQISNVMVDGSSVGAVSTYTFSNISTSHAILATFMPAMHTITANAQGNGSITPAGAIQVSAGSGKTYMIAAASKQKIADVAVDGSSVGVVSKYSFSNINTDHNITATFAPVTYTISASAQGNGTISPVGLTAIPYGSGQTYTITPYANCKILDVKVDGKSVGAVSTYSFTGVGANHSITAVFAPIPYTVSTAVQGNGTISPSGSVSVTSGSSMTFKITPATGYQIAAVLVDGIPAGNISSYTFTGVTGNHAIQANFISLNPLPVAEAGPVQVVTGGAMVTLDGSNSTASEGSLSSSVSTEPVPAGSSIASYKWTQISGPSVTLSNPSAPVCTFKAPTVTEGAALTFGLSITTTNGLSASDTCVVNVSGTDLPPTANAGPNQTVSPYTIVTLDGSQSGSDDPAATYRWVQTSGSAVEIGYADTARATFVAPDPGFEGSTLGFALTVTNTSGLKAIDQCLVNITGAAAPPEADAGSNQTAYGNETVVLTGSGSADSNGGIASYRWTQLSGSPVTLSDPRATNPTFTAPEPTTGSLELLFMLTITDEGGLSSSAKCLVTVPATQLSAQTR
jgi:hypothetical protein